MTRLADSPAQPTSAAHTSRPLRIAFMTTVGKNVGDEFIREGIRSFLDEALAGVGYDPYYVNKHDLTTLHRPVLDEIEPLTDKFRDADVIIQAGAPVFWSLGESRCYNEDWAKALWHERIFKLAKEKPFLNLGAGSCQAREEDLAPLLDDPKCVEFIRQVGACAKLTTSRDALTASAFCGAGVQGCDLVPCPAFHAARRVNGGQPPIPRDFVAINLMELAGHYLLKPEFDPRRWSDVVLATLAKLRERYRLLFVAHDEAEVRFLRYCNRPDEMIFYSTDYRDYLSVYSRVAGIIANRVHGAVCVAGFGRPAVIVGNDSRIGIARPINIPAHDATDVTADWIVDSFNQQMDRRDQLQKERLELREASAQKYITAIQKTLL